MAQRVRVTRSPGITLRYMSDTIPNEWAMDTHRPTDVHRNMRHTVVIDRTTGFTKDVIDGRGDATVTGSAAVRMVRPANPSTNPMDDVTHRRVMVRGADGTTTFPTVPTYVAPADDYRGKRVTRIRTTDDADAPLPAYRGASDPHAPARGRTRSERKNPLVPATEPDRFGTTRPDRATSADVDTFIRTVYGYTGSIDARMRRLARDAMADAAATARYTA